MVMKNDWKNTSIQVQLRWNIENKPYPSGIFWDWLGVRETEVCTKCGSEYLSNEVLSEIESEVKKKKLFGLEKQAQITKSGNSLVIRIPPEIAKFTDVHYKDNIRIYPAGKNRIEIETES